MELTASAVTQLTKILAEDDNAVALRVLLQGGGCNGLTYSFTLEEKINEEDKGDVIVATDGVVVILDTVSYDLLSEATLDYQQSLQGSSFSLSTPTSTSCGCGQSFTL